MQQIPSTLKLNFKDDMRRVPFTERSYDALKKQIMQLYSIQEGTFSIKYKDDEGDLVTIASEEEFKEALSCNEEKIFRLTITEDKKEQKGGKCGRKQWRKHCGKRDGNNHHHGHRFGFLHNLRNIANNVIEGGQFDPILENLLNSGFCKVEHNHVCDGCETQISGTRYHCTSCPDFDFCSNCFETKIKTHDENHKFESINALDALKEAFKNGEGIDSFFMPGSSSDPVEKKVHHAFCDRCNQTIEGIRWKCMDCDNFDFCNSCYLTANGKESLKGHLSTHSFAKIEEPENFTSFKQEKQQYLQKKIEEEKQKQEQLESQRLEKERLEKEKQLFIQIPISEPKIVSPFEKKLEDLATMGFSDRKRNIQFLIKNKGDIALTIQDLLN